MTSQTSQKSVRLPARTQVWLSQQVVSQPAANADNAQTPGCAIVNTACLAGVRMEHASIADGVLGKVDNLYMTISSLSVRYLEVSLPTWSRPLTIVLKGVTVELMQRNLPQVRFLWNHPLMVSADPGQ